MAFVVVVDVDFFFFFFFIYPLPLSVRLYPLYEIRPSPSRIEILTHILLDSGVDGDRSVSVLQMLQMLQMLQQQQQLDVAASAPLSPVGASEWYARRSGMQGVAGGMLLEEKTERFLVPIWLPLILTLTSCAEMNQISHECISSFIIGAFRGL